MRKPYTHQGQAVNCQVDAGDVLWPVQRLVGLGCVAVAPVEVAVLGGPDDGGCGSAAEQGLAVVVVIGRVGCHQVRLDHQTTAVADEVGLAFIAHELGVSTIGADGRLRVAQVVVVRHLASIIWLR